MSDHDLAGFVVRALMTGSGDFGDDVIDAARQVLEEKVDDLDLSQEDFIAMLLSRASQAHDGDVTIDADELQLDDVKVRVHVTSCKNYVSDAFS